MRTAIEPRFQSVQTRMIITVLTHVTTYRRSLIGRERTEHARSDASNIRRVWQRSPPACPTTIFAYFFKFLFTSIAILLIVVFVRLFWGRAN